MRLGVVVLPEFTGPEASRIWRRVEDLGVDHVWTFDHIAWRKSAGGPWFDAFGLLAAAALGTERVELGTLVTTPNFRHPVTTATQAMTLDQLSGGRLVLGLGAGVSGRDASVLGGPRLEPAERADRFEEFVFMLDTLLRHPTTTLRGRCYQAVEVPMVPGCVRRPRAPFAIAASGRRGMRLVARYARSWVTIGNPRTPGEEPESRAFGTLRAQLDRLAEACLEVGRDVHDLHKLVNLSLVAAEPYASAQRFADLLGTCRELGFTDVVVNHPRPADALAGDLDLFERAVAAACSEVC